MQFKTLYTSLSGRSVHSTTQFDFSGNQEAFSHPENADPEPILRLGSG